MAATGVPAPEPRLQVPGAAATPPELVWNGAVVTGSWQWAAARHGRVAVVRDVRGGWEARVACADDLPASTGNREFIRASDAMAWCESRLTAVEAPPGTSFAGSRGNCAPSPL